MERARSNGSEEDLMVGIRSYGAYMPLGRLPHTRGEGYELNGKSQIKTLRYCMMLEVESICLKLGVSHFSI
jgi:hypothetical protein